MSDKYLQIQSFKYGLDGRRDELSSVPGTLVQLQNAHINAGGEIEQRMSFVIGDHSFPTNTFGLQDTDAGLVTFGSDAAPNATLPTGVTYQRLVPPESQGSMLAVVWSTNYLGKAFVLAVFTIAGITFAYYDGVLVGSSRDGLILPYNVGGDPETVSLLAQDLADQINAISGWSAVANFAVIGGVAVATPGAVILKTPSGVHVSPEITVVSTNGLLSSTLVDQNSPSTAAASASVVFTINAGGAGDTITLTAPALANGTGTKQLTGGAVSFNTSLAQTAADVVSKINLLAGATGYTAQRTGAVITVYAPADFGAVTYNLTVVTTGTMTTFLGGGGTSLFGITLKSSGNANVQGNAIQLVLTKVPTLVQLTVTASYTGAAGLVSFVWSEVDSQGNAAANLSGITMSNVTGSAVNFSAVVAPGNAAQPGNNIIGHFLVTATDAGSGSIVKRFFSVTLVAFYPYSS